MAKLRTVEERINPKRKRRLRKKLHVAEFKEYSIEFFIPSVYYEGSFEKFDEDIDELLDFTDQLLASHNLRPMAMSISGEKGTLCFFEIPIELYSIEKAESILDSVRAKYGEIIDIKIDDAWFPEDNVDD